MPRVYSMQKRAGLGGLAAGAGGGSFCDGGNDVFLWKGGSQIRVMFCDMRMC